MDSHGPHGRQPLVHRDERASKAYERLQRKLKERQTGGGAKDRPGSPPPSPQKNHCAPPSADVPNGVQGKSEPEQGLPVATAAARGKQAGKTKSGLCVEAETEGSGIPPCSTFLSPPLRPSVPPLLFFSSFVGIKGGLIVSKAVGP